jgi:hypothetical protein
MVRWIMVHSVDMEKPRTVRLGASFQQCPWWSLDDAEDAQDHEDQHNRADDAQDAVWTSHGCPFPPFPAACSEGPPAAYRRRSSPAAALGVSGHHTRPIAEHVQNHIPAYTVASSERHHHQFVTLEPVHPLRAEVPEVEADHDRMIPLRDDVVHDADRFQHLWHGIQAVQRAGRTAGDVDPDPCAGHEAWSDGSEIEVNSPQSQPSRKAAAEQFHGRYERLRSA